MLPKPEKSKKLNKNLLGDAEITKESDEVVAAKRLKNKRRLILVSLGLTVGLSFVFWSFRQFQSFVNSPKTFNFHPSFNFKLPEFDFAKDSSSNQNLTSDNDIKNFLKDKNWSVVSYFVNQPGQPTFSQNVDSSSFESEVNLLSSLNKLDQSQINLNLPQGLLFQEKLTQNSFLLYQNLITLPSTQLFISIKIPDASLTDNQSNLYQLVDMLYWYSVSQLNSD